MQFVIYPGAPSEQLGQVLALSGLDPQPLGDADLDKDGAAAEWSLLLIELGDEPLRRLRLARRLAEDTGVPVFLVVTPDQTAFLEEETTVADFAVLPAEATELRTRVRRLLRTTQADDQFVHHDLLLNTATYQATIDGEPIDLTYMEYELLRFFVENKGRVWSREQLLSKVWGYDYFGGARTVDVHVRRLRSKLGEERAGWITTVRSVGYRFG